MAFLISTSIETIQWSEMKACLVCVMIFSSDIISVNIKSNVFPGLHVGPDMCCSNPIASIVLLKAIPLLSSWLSVWVKDVECLAVSAVSQFGCNSDSPSVVEQ